jgi:hypothetical protein
VAPVLTRRRRRSARSADKTDQHDGEVEQKAKADTLNPNELDAFDDAS